MQDAAADLGQAIAELDAAGEALDRLAARRLDDGESDALQQLAEGLAAAEEGIAALVQRADRAGCLDDRRLLDLKAAWTARFTRLHALVERERGRLSAESELRQSRHRAADAYLKNQRP